MQLTGCYVAVDSNSVQTCRRASPIVQDFHNKNPERHSSLCVLWRNWERLDGTAYIDVVCERCQRCPEQVLVYCGGFRRELGREPKRLEEMSINFAVDDAPKAHGHRCLADVCDDPFGKVFDGDV